MKAKYNKDWTRLKSEASGNYSLHIDLLILFIKFDKHVSFFVIGLGYKNQSHKLTPHTPVTRVWCIHKKGEKIPPSAQLLDDSCGRRLSWIQDEYLSICTFPKYTHALLPYTQIAIWFCFQTEPSQFESSSSFPTDSNNSHNAWPFKSKP